MDHASTALWIDNDAALDAFVQSAHPSGVIGMDTEFMRRDSYYARLALLQIHLDGRTALIDPLAVAPNAALRGRLEHPDTVCVMHSAGEDIETLANWLPAGPARLFDTQIAAALAGFGSGLGYQKLVEAITGVQLSKGETRSDWLQRPLTAAQKDYAALDVIHLDALHAALDARLGELGRREWLAEDCAKLCRRADRAAFDPQPQLALRAAAEWPAEQQALLRRLLLWREQTARRIDAPRPWLIDDKQALSLAEQ
ncbi:MAG TPA: ribonuclease D, partial [Rhodanobacteraceae bacterium]|nr:ribonuclease D [Rhodanobacteraceae bacterium]